MELSSSYYHLEQTQGLSLWDFAWFRCHHQQL